MIDLPALYASADKTAVAAASKTKRVHAAELVLLLLSAVAGVTSWRVGAAHLDAFAAVGTLTFIGALISALVRNMSHPQADWVLARALAEGIKTAAWRYAVAGVPYRLDDAEADDAFLRHIDAVLTAGRDLHLHPHAGEEITSSMRTTRASSLDHRKSVYGACRLDDQVDFYLRRSQEHDAARRRWFWLGAAANVAGIVGGVLRLTGVVDVDLVGVAAAGGSAAVAWSQLHQYRTLAAAYALTAQQLQIARDRLPIVDDDGWPAYVDSAEDVMVREHSVWLAHRGSRGVGMR
jgi:hypothetical protein